MIPESLAAQFRFSGRYKAAKHGGIVPLSESVLAFGTNCPVDSRDHQVMSYRKVGMPCGT